MQYLKWISYALLLIFSMACQPEKTRKSISSNAQSNPKAPVQVPLDLCIEAHLQEIGSLAETEKFCNCYVPKFAQLLSYDTLLLNAASKGLLDEIPLDKKAQLLEFYQSCFSVEDIKKQLEQEGFSPEVLAGIRRGIKNALATTNAAEIIDIEKFCDCMIAEIPKRYGILEVMGGAIMQSNSYKDLQDSCAFAHQK